MLREREDEKRCFGSIGIRNTKGPNCEIGVSEITERQDFTHELLVLPYANFRQSQLNTFRRLFQEIEGFQR